MDSAFSAMNAINKEYDAHPEGWRVLMGKDSEGYATVYCLHNDHGWTLKFPKYGMNGLADKFKIEEDELVQDIINDPYSFGFRIVSEHMFSILLKQGGDAVRYSKDSRPLSEKEICERANEGFVSGVLSGPVIMTESPIAPISAAQVALEQKLKKNIEHLTDGMYI
jgi:hypothetical protein